MIKQPSFSQARRKAQPYVRLPPTGGDARPAVADAVPVNAKRFVPAGFKLPSRPIELSDAILETANFEQEECDAYLAAVKHWWLTVHKKWRDKCDRWRSRHHQLKLDARDLGLGAPDPLVLPPEPTCDVQRPACVQRYIDELMAMPVAERAEQCRAGAGGHAGLVIARKIVHEDQRAAFAASDLDLEIERKAIMDAENMRLRRADEVGPNGETLATHHKETTTEKCGGKGRTIQVEQWVLNEPDQ